MVKRITISIPGFNSNSKAHTSAFSEAARMLDQIAIGDVATETGTVFQPNHSGTGSGKETRSKQMIAVCKDESTQQGSVEKVHSILVSSIETPDGTNIETQIEDIGEYYIG